jgi:hypothetical protein
MPVIAEWHGIYEVCVAREICRMMDLARPKQAGNKG